MFRYTFGFTVFARIVLELVHSVRLPQNTGRPIVRSVLQLTHITTRTKYHEVQSFRFQVSRLEIRHKISLQTWNLKPGTFDLIDLAVASCPLEKRYALGAMLYAFLNTEPPASRGPEPVLSFPLVFGRRRPQPQKTLPL